MYQIKDFEVSKEQDIPDEEEISSISISEVIKKLLRFWKIFVISAFIGGVIGLFFYLNTTPKYETKAMLLLNVEDDGSSAFKSLQELVRSYNPRLMYENEVVIMKSNKLSLRTIKSYDYHVAYFVPEFIRRRELFGNSPIQVELDINHPQLINTNFIIHEVNLRNKTFKLKIKNPSNLIIDYSTDKINEIKSDDDVIKHFNTRENLFRFDEWIVSPLFKFKVLFKGEEFPFSELYFTFNNPYELAEQLQKSLTFTPTAKESSGLDILIKSNTPEKTIFLLKRHVEEYEAMGKEIKNENIIKTLDFIRQQLNLLQDSLSYIESRIERVKSSQMLLDSKSQGAQLLSKLFELDKKDFELQMADKFLKYLIATSDVSDYGISTVPQASGINDPIILSLTNQLNQLKLQRRKLTDLSDNNPIVKQLNDQIKSTLSLIKSHAENLLKVNSEAISQNKRKIEEIETKLSQIPGLEIGLISIERTYKVIENIYNFFLYKKSEMEISLNFNKSGILFIDYENREPQKKSPIFIVNVVGGSMGTLFLAVAIFIGRIFTKTTIDEVTNYNIFTYVNFIAQIPHNHYHIPNVVYHQPQSIISESFRIIRSKLKFFKPADQDSTLVVITSFVPGEGKSFCSLNLATLLAMGGKKTLLIGADMRKPKLYDELKLTNDVGLSTLLSGGIEYPSAIRQTFIDNLYLLSAGPVPPNPSELIITEKFNELMTFAKGNFDYIVIDTPPMMAVNDAYEIMNYSDVNLIIARKNVTQQSFLQNLERKIKQNQLRNTTVVLNDFDTTITAYGLGTQLKGYGYIKE
ncbi:exopolysaccharide transport family protein [Schleiferia thermophila]|jgi:capsular exopolysaccharide synthesis family protein|uniref:Capsular exopolysaccharide synthesis family protein n=1 Tax=Schleiferia thermophila TaxID=884107 RepID=A0A369A815_9FLAO|nr:polysaccharide biosynthesis tyrosine autokinase [Schleiferia thermophila]KFD40219.1 hypothetical protein AT05_00230 [Schleiferia thermophila str. Yellowstone]RCX05285.1 capsular exopolysaccharide synthesis family protein [Schleiferia thermophila]GCD79205.1 sugar transporter [Schleiferia thermophila]